MKEKEKEKETSQHLTISTSQHINHRKKRHKPKKAQS